MSLYLIFMYAPQEATMGEVQRIFYIHVASRVDRAAGLFPDLCRQHRILVEAAEWGGRFRPRSGGSGLCLLHVRAGYGTTLGKTGLGNLVDWDARLTLTFVLWLLFVAYLMLRSYVINPGRSAVLAAVVGIIGFVDVPIDYMAIRWWRTQHPSPVIAGGEGSGLDPRMWVALLVTWGAFLCLFAYLMRQYLRFVAGRSASAAAGGKCWDLESG